MQYPVQTIFKCFFNITLYKGLKIRAPVLLSSFNYCVKGHIKLAKPYMYHLFSQLVRVNSINTYYGLVYIKRTLTN